MAIYKTTELLETLTDFYASGAYLTDLDIDGEACLSLLGLLPDEVGIQDFADPVEGDIEVVIKSDQPCYGMIFSMDELVYLHQHLANALEYYKECLASDEYSDETKDDIRNTEAQARSMHSRLDRFLHQ